MSLSLPSENTDGAYTTRGSVYIPAHEGVTKWFSGDVYTVKITAADTNGSFGLIEASVPPGSGPVAHAHADQDETFYLLSGELEFLDGDETFMARPGDLVFVRRRIRHRFKNIGLHPAECFSCIPRAARKEFSSKAATSRSQACKYSRGGRNA
jgi:mannose-6-phosphate isomerase-like protein (cupin superfamily)